MQTKIKWQTVLGGIALASVLVSASAVAVADDFGAWDTNGDGFIEYNEWNSRYDYDPIYTSWDTNEDGLLDNDEWGTGVYNSYDRNDDGFLDDDEWGLFTGDSDDGWLDF